jgi:hypothetical protein
MSAERKPCPARVEHALQLETLNRYAYAMDPAVVEQRRTRLRIELEIIDRLHEELGPCEDRASNGDDLRRCAWSYPAYEVMRVLDEYSSSLAVDLLEVSIQYGLVDIENYANSGH